MTDEKQLKNTKLRHLEYYDMQGKLDMLYEDSQQEKVFTDLMSIITSDENIRLAYRNIKSNEGSRTPGIDGMTINDLRDMPLGDFVNAVRNRLQWHQPKPVRRVEIPKPNGKMRPLGIPVMWDRIVQQCIFQVLEPICEAKFHEHSYGFRPNRAAEHALARAIALVQLHHKYHVVDIDIEGFFDNVNHSKLIKQIWAFGIRDKKLISVIKAMLKAPVSMPDGKMVTPGKGTPQGGVLSPLLSNIVLNELDWWVSSQWETSPVCSKHDCARPEGGINRGNAYRAMRRTNLKEMYVVRYADDFKIFCATHADAVNAFIATEKWLNDRLKLGINKEKSKVVNLKKGYSEFLGFKLKARKRRKSYVAKVHICDKAKRRISEDLKEQLKLIVCPPDIYEEAKEVQKYNSMVMGMHNYFSMANMVAADFGEISYSLNIRMKTRLQDRLKKQGDLTGFKTIKERYGQSKQLRFVDGLPLTPAGYVRNRHPIAKNRSIKPYTPKGRERIHSELLLDKDVMCAYMRSMPSSASVEFTDNCISRYAAQGGRCAVTGQFLELDEIHCHRIKRRTHGGQNKYHNLVIISEEVHLLVHSRESTILNATPETLNLTNKQLSKVNKLREAAKLPPIAERCSKRKLALSD